MRFCVKQASKLCKTLKRSDNTEKRVCLEAEILSLYVYFFINKLVKLICFYATQISILVIFLNSIMLTNFLECCNCVKMVGISIFLRGSASL